MPLQSKLLLGISILLLGSQACTDRIEGCLDVRAANYRPDADRDCCCEWPVATVSIQHLAGEANHFPDSVYVNEAGEAYRLLDAFLLLSDFRMHFRGQAPLSVWLDTIRLMNADSSFSWVRNDLLLLTRATNNLQLGRFIGDGLLDSITFTLGVPAHIQDYPPGAWPEGHPVRRNALRIWDADMGYVSAASLHVPAPFTDTITWRTHQPVAVRLSVDQWIAAGFSPSNLNIRIDYLQWFAKQKLAPSIPIPDELWPWQIGASLP
jgi:hypothetical protein